MNYFLVDYENVKIDGMSELKGLQDGDSLIIFYSETCKNITIDIMEAITRMKLRFKSFKVKTRTKNALDFQLSSYLGFLIGKGNDNARYYIFSNDKGYDCLCDYWNGQNVKVQRISPREQAEQMKTEQMKVAKPRQRGRGKSKVEEDNLATMEEIRKYLTDEDMPEAVLEIFNSYKSKQAICNGISKKCKDSKMTSVIYKKLKPLLKEKKKS